MVPCKEVVSGMKLQSTYQTYKHHEKKIREEERASGISTPELSELDQALEDLIVREDEADRGIQEATAQKRKDDKKDAEEIRKRAMERLGDRMKRSENEGKVKKRRSSGNNTLEYLKERNERIDELRKQELARVATRRTEE